MRFGALKLSPDYDTLSWFIDISFCGAHSMTSLKSIIQPFIILGVNGPSCPGQVYIYSLPNKLTEKMILPINDPFLNSKLMAELSFKGLSQFNDDWKFTLVDTKTNKEKAVFNQDPILVRPGFMNTNRSPNKFQLFSSIDFNPIPEPRLELHIEIGSFLTSLTNQQKE